jgi:hypothetical protein
MEIVNSKRAAAKSQALKIIAARTATRPSRQENRHSLVRHRLHSLPGKQRRISRPIWATAIRSAARPSTFPRAAGRSRTWETGAYDALVTVENLDDITYDGPECCAYATEKTNGFGYRNPGRSGRSPYLWGGTNLQKPGKFVSDQI